MKKYFVQLCWNDDLNCDDSSDPLQKAAYDYEHSELLLYQNMVIRESGDTAGALEHLEKYRDQICDKPFWLETKASLLIGKCKAPQAFSTIKTNTLLM